MYKFYNYLNIFQLSKNPPVPTCLNKGHSTAWGICGVTKMYCIGPLLLLLVITSWRQKTTKMLIEVTPGIVLKLYIYIFYAFPAILTMSDFSLDTTIMSQLCFTHYTKNIYITAKKFGCFNHCMDGCKIPHNFIENGTLQSIYSTPYKKWEVYVG